MNKEYSEIYMRIRYADLDIVKGIAIILMVLGHSEVSDGFTRFIYLFHMAVFVVGSGYCYNETYSKGGVLLYIYKRVKALYIPYVCWMFVLIIAHNSLISLNIYTDSADFLKGNLGNTYGIESFYSIKDVAIEMAKAVFLLGSEQLFGASWFIRVLFYVSIVWCVVDTILVKLCCKRLNEWRILISLLCLLVGWEMIQHDIMNFSNVPNILTAYILFTMGIYMRKLRERYGRNITFKSIVVGIVGGLWILLVIYSLQVNINMVSFDSLGLYLAASCAGWVFLHMFSMMIERLGGGVAKLLGYIGKNTMPIVLFHFVSFKLVTCVEIYIYHLPWFRMASFPIYKSQPAWWVLYMLVGVLLPLVLNMLFHKVSSKEDCVLSSYKRGE